MPSSSLNTHTASTNPHRVVMAVCTLAVLCLTVTLFTGWQHYFQMREERQMILRVAATAPSRMPATPVAIDSGSKKPMSKAAHDLLNGSSPVVAEAAAPSAPSAEPSASTPSLMGKNLEVSLVDIAKTETTGQSIASAPVAEPVSPKQVDAATDVLQKFWHATSTDEKADYVLHKERVKPLMHNYYNEQHNVDPQSGSMLNSSSYRINGRSVLLMTFSSARPGDVLEMALLPTSNGSYLIDWESYVGYSELSWTDFKKRRVAAPTLFRCFAAKSDYYNYEFEDEKKFLSLNLLSPDGLFSVHAYCERTSSIGQALAQMVGQNAHYMGLTLRLAFQEQAKSDHCVRITGIIADRWLVLSDK